jgi:outer membrane protein TolC
MFELRGAQRQLAVSQTRTIKRTVALTQDRLTAGRGTAFDIDVLGQSCNSRSPACH